MPSPIRLVVAIDFGTARSGYAYTFLADPEQIRDAQGIWPGASNNSTKTPTELLIGPDGEPCAWGYEAQNEYARLDPPEASGYTLLRYFKMAVHVGQTETLDKFPVETTPGGTRVIVTPAHRLPVKSMVARYLAYLKQDLFERQFTHKAAIQPDEIRWCLSVPAIWTDADMQLMREAAIEAGLISSTDDRRRLVMVPEPEAAAISCDVRVKRSMLKDLGPDGCFMVLDAGGGTVDITAHERAASSETDLHTLAYGEGGPYGSATVDRAFGDHLWEVLGDTVMAKLELDAQFASARLELLRNWEFAKVNFKPSDQGVRVLIPHMVHRLLREERRGRDFLDNLAKQNHGEDGYLVLDRHTVLRLFEPALDGLIARAREQLAGLGERRHDATIWLVGGFARSPVLQERVRQSLHDDVQAIEVPPNPDDAVLFGAAVYGVQPEVIRSRRSRLTYGIRASQPYEEGRDPKDTRIPSERHPGSFLCPDRFSIFVNAGDVIDMSFRKDVTYTPVHSRSSEMEFPILATTHTAPRYSNEQGVVTIGTITIRRSNTSHGLDWPVTVRMTFEDLEIHVEATDARTGVRQQTRVDFSSTYFPELVGRSDA